LVYEIAGADQQRSLGPTAVTDPNFICYIRICHRQIGDQVLGYQQPLEHLTMNESTIGLEISPHAFQAGFQYRPFDKPINVVKINQGFRSAWWRFLAKRHCNKAHGPGYFLVHQEFSTGLNLIDAISSVKRKRERLPIDAPSRRSYYVNVNQWLLHPHTSFNMGFSLIVAALTNTSGGYQSIENRYSQKAMLTDQISQFTYTALNSTHILTKGN
jgi:hypothetical protein